MRVLSESVIKSFLKSLSRSEIINFQQVLSNSLRKYHDDSSLIPPRIVISRDDLEALHLFMPCTTPGLRAGLKTLAGSSEGFKGSVMIIDENNGDVIGILNALTLTAFRTALASIIPLLKFFDAYATKQEVSAFGNGLQAYWHVRLTLVLFGDNISKVRIFVRQLNDKTKALRDSLNEEFPDHEIELVIDNKDNDLSTSSIIYGCIPSTQPSILLKNINKERQTFISVIGSYKPNMFEVDDGIVQEVLEQGKIIVDSYEHTLCEAGELIKNKVTKKDVIEIGELEQFTMEDIATDRNLVLVKIVGLAIMDISVGTEILEIAQAKNLGVEVEL